MKGGRGEGKGWRGGEGREGEGKVWRGGEGREGEGEAEGGRESRNTQVLTRRPTLYTQLTKGDPSMVVLLQLKDQLVDLLQKRLGADVT